MACCGLRPFSDLMLTFVGALICGFIPLVKFIALIIRKGPTRMLCHRTRNVRPEILKNSEFGTHEIVRLPNTRMKLHCVVGGPSDKPLMLFLHGFPELWYSWRHQIKEFCKDYRLRSVSSKENSKCKTVAIDMRGYGDSDKPCCISDYILDKLVEDVNQLITELGYEKCILVGHDWGGVVAWSFAALHPERLDKLVVCNIPHPTAFQKHVKTALSQVRKSWYIFFFQWPILPELFMLGDDVKALEGLMCKHAKRGTFSIEDVEALKYTFATYRDWHGPINYYRAGFRYASPEVDAALQRGKISVPTLMIWGTNDSALEKKSAEMSSDYVEDFTVHFIESANHCVQQEEPQQVNRFMRQFLAK